MMEQLVVAHTLQSYPVWLVAAGAVVGCVAGRRSDTLRPARAGRGLRPLTAVALGAIGFQVLHFAEHLLQVGYWLVHPADPPWLTPWAAAARDGLAWLTDGAAGTGNEVLHLVGNVVFLAGLVCAALAMAPRTLADAGERGPWLRRALWVQSLHVAEHLALTATWLAWGRAVGASNLLGLLDPATPVGSGTRVLVHFVINLVATAFALRAVVSLPGSGFPSHSSPLGLVGRDENAGTARLRIDEPQGDALARPPEQTLAAAQQERIDHELVLVDQAMFGQRPNELRAAQDHDVPPRLALEGGDRCADLALQ